MPQPVVLYDASGQPYYSSAASNQPYYSMPPPEYAQHDELKSGGTVWERTGSTYSGIYQTIPDDGEKHIHCIGASFVKVIHTCV